METAEEILQRCDRGVVVEHQRGSMSAGDKDVFHISAWSWMQVLILHCDVQSCFLTKFSGHFPWGNWTVDIASVEGNSVQRQVLSEFVSVWGNSTWNRIDGSVCRAVWRLPFPSHQQVAFCHTFLDRCVSAFIPLCLRHTFPPTLFARNGTRAWKASSCWSLEERSECSSEAVVRDICKLDAFSLSGNGSILCSFLSSLFVFVSCVARHWLLLILRVLSQSTCPLECVHQDFVVTSLSTAITAVSIYI